MPPLSDTIGGLRFAAMDFESAGAARGETDQPVQIGIAACSRLEDEPEPAVPAEAASAHAAEATSFIHYLSTPAAQDILGRYGFAKP